MSRRRYIYFTVSSWSQSIDHYRDKDPAKEISGAGLNVIVRALPDTKLALSDGRKLEDFDISLGIVRGEFPPEEHQKANFATDAFGGLWYLQDQNMIHGWFFFNPSNFDAIWNQVTIGGYSNCQLSLGVAPEEFERWKENPLSIVSASFRFDRKLPAREAAPRKGWLG